MRVMLATGSWPPMRCGVGDYTCRLASALTRQVDAIAVLTTARSDLERVGGVELYPAIPDWSLRDALRAGRAFRSFRPDIVHVQYPTLGYGYGRLQYAIPLLGALCGARIVQTHHEPFEAAGFCRLRLAVPAELVTVRSNFRDLLSQSTRRRLSNRTLHHVPNASAIPTASLDARRRAEVRAAYAPVDKRLVVFFGFVFPHKGAHLLFEIADIASDHLVFAGNRGFDEAYDADLIRRATDEWRGNAKVLGTLPPMEVAELLAVADAVVLPFAGGGGEWNSSVHAATANGARVITTSTERDGLDSTGRIFYAAPDDVAAMRASLRSIPVRHRNEVPTVGSDQAWDEIARRHVEIYQSALSQTRGTTALVDSKGPG